jgi:hypothetical protein
VGGGEAGDDLGEAELRRRARGVEQQEAAAVEAGEEVDLVE